MNDAYKKNGPGSGVSIQVPSLKECIERIASRNHVSFLTDFNSQKDGRTIYLFGELRICFEDGIVYALKKNVWIPITLDDLMDTIEEEEEV